MTDDIAQGMSRSEYEECLCRDTHIVGEPYFDAQGHRLRRNDVVLPALNDGWVFYGRVNRRIDASHVEIINSGKHILIYRDADLVLTHYRGYWNQYGELRGKFPVFSHMPSLRRLKQMAAFYDRSAWKRHRERGDRTSRIGRYWDRHPEEYEEMKREIAALRQGSAAETQ